MTTRNETLELFCDIYASMETEWSNPFHKTVESMAFTDGVYAVLDALGLRGDYIAFQAEMDSLKYGES